MYYYEKSINLLSYLFNCVLAKSWQIFQKYINILLLIGIVKYEKQGGLGELLLFGCMA
jgi:hypothetical protein